MREYRQTHSSVLFLFGMLLGLLLSGSTGASDTGAIRGTVIDLDFGAPIPGARITVVEAGASTRSTAEGTFLLTGIPAGRYSVTVARDGFERAIYTGVVVLPGQIADLRVELSSEIIDLPELVVTGTDLLGSSEIGILEIRSSAVAVQDAISAEMFSKAGVSDVAGAIKLVVGASVIEGKYATVRGLSDRYTGTTVNGVRIPSADPRKRAVQMDLFPTGTVENVTVTKTFTPDLQGDFTGGGVEVKTKSIPDGRFVSYSVGGEYDTEATGNDRFLTYEGGGVNRLGFDADGVHDLPEEAYDPLPKSLQAIRVFPDDRVTEEDIEASRAYDRLTRAFAPAMGVIRDAPEPNHDFSVVAGNRFNLGGPRELGIVGALTYKHRYDFYDGGVNNNAGVSTSDGTIFVKDDRSDSKGEDSLLIGALADVLYRIDDNNELSFKAIFNQSAQDEARFQVEDIGSTENNLQLEQNQALHYVERMVRSFQFHGHHFLERDGEESATVDWVVSTNATRQDEPDVRFFRNLFSYSFETGTGSARTPFGGTTPQLNTRRIWREGVEKSLLGKADISLPFVQWSGLEGKMKFGFYSGRTRRNYDQRSFFYLWTSKHCCRNPEKAENRLKNSYSVQDPDDLWTDVFTDPDRIGLASNIDSPNVSDVQTLWVIQPLGDDVSYSGDQDIRALYAMGELPVLPKVKLIGGARLEKTRIEILPQRADGDVQVIEVRPSGDRAIVEIPQEEAAADIEDDTILPAVSVVYEPVPEMNVRISWSRTLARPTFRELAPVATEEFLFGDEFVGNPELSLSKITNYDIRWEWFRRPGEVLAVSLFEKEILNPIEFLSFGASSRNFIQPVNFDKGSLTGVEVEGRTALDVVWKRLEDFTVGMNFAYIDSEVEVPEREQQSLGAFSLDEPTRRLLGQPETVFNANITWENPRTGTSAALFYNRVGETLTSGSARGDVETGGVPNIFEEPFDTLNANFSQKFKSGMKLTVKAKNLQQRRKKRIYRTPAGLEEVKSLRDTSIRWSVSAKWSW